MIVKNRNREDYSFANINLLGKCNAKCFFCLGEDIPELLSIHNQIGTHFTEWKNFGKFIDKCKAENIRNLYITGQNTDSLLYKYLGELIDFLQDVFDFNVGIRTNGYLFEKKPELIDVVNKCKANVGVSIHSMNKDTNFKILGRSHIPDWDLILPQIKNLRVSIVVNRYNISEFFGLLEYLSRFDNIKYIQARRISTDTRYEQFAEDIQRYEELFKFIEATNKKVGDFYTAEIYNFFGKNVSFWRTVQTSVNSVNYFTDGTISGNYFVIEGYIENYKDKV